MGRVEGFLWLLNSVAKDPAFHHWPSRAGARRGEGSGRCSAGITVLGRNVPGVGQGREMMALVLTLWKPALIWLGLDPWREGKNLSGPLLWAGDVGVGAQPHCSQSPVSSCGEGHREGTNQLPEAGSCWDRLSQRREFPFKGA